MKCPIKDCSAKCYHLTGLKELSEMQEHLMKDHRKFFTIDKLAEIRSQEKEEE